MKYELMDKFGEFSLDEDNKGKDKYTSVQLAFEYLGYRHALTKQQKGKLDGEKEMKCWAVLEKNYRLSPACVRLLFEIVYQCPKEFRIEHLSQSTRSNYMSHLETLKERGFIYDGKDFYGDYYEVSYDLMRTIAYGEDWFDVKKPVSLISEPDEEMLEDSAL